MEHCELCYTTDPCKLDESFICDTCELHYCEDCSYTFTIHYQFQGGRCYLCADQYRRTRITKNEIRENKLKLITI